MEEGETFFISPGLKPSYSTRSGIVRLMQMNPLLVGIQVYETDRPEIHVGQCATVRFDAFPEHSFKGTVASIQPMLSTVSHTSTMKSRIANPRHTLDSKSDHHDHLYSGIFDSGGGALSSPDPVQSDCGPDHSVFSYHCVCGHVRTRLYNQHLFHNRAGHRYGVG